MDTRQACLHLRLPAHAHAGQRKDRCVRQRRHLELLQQPDRRIQSYRPPPHHHRQRLRKPYEERSTPPRSPRTPWSAPAAATPTTPGGSMTCSR
jgi:hypothetical protein